ncbi:MAG: YbaN family protein [Gammaproteobacteria bacterium]|nr:YbaN family protein [Gammaproteobacteria bacterium]
MTIGVISLILGVIGIVLPLLPTTPFLLLSASCFAKSSDKFYQWLINHRWFGSYIQNYRSGRGLPLKVKCTTIALLWLSIGSSVIFFVDFFWAKLLMIAIACCVSCYLLTRPTLKSTPVQAKAKLSIE